MKLDDQKPDLFYTGLIDESNIPSSCPKCNGSDHYVDPQGSPRHIRILRGPFFRHEMRDTELYFDLNQKYLLCTRCGSEISILDFQVLVEEISAALPPIKARSFSMKMMDLYHDSREYAIEVLSILRGDFSPEDEPEHDYLKEVEDLLQTPGIRSDD